MAKYLKNLLLCLLVILFISGGFVLFRDTNISITNNATTESSVDFSNMTMNCLGDSITFGYDTTNNGKQMLYPYPTLVKNRLGLAKVRNYGITSSTLTSVHTERNPMSIRYDEMISNADIISVMGGVNDYWLGDIELGTINDNDTTTIYGALNVLANGLKAKYPNSFIFFMTPYKWGKDTGLNKLGFSLEDIANAIKEVCSLHNIAVLDMYNLGQIEIDFDNENSDLLHPSQEFIQNYTAPQIAQFIKDNYKQN